MTHMQRLSIGFALTLCLAARGASAQTVAPSFDCTRASAADERAICANDRLAQLDQLVTASYTQAEKSAPTMGMTKKDQLDALKGAARDHLADRRACGAAILCILDAQAAAIQDFGQYGSQAALPDWIGDFHRTFAQAHPEIIGTGLPKVVGHCTRTKISAISDRGGGPLKAPAKDDVSNGTVVQYANGGYGVSYGYEPEPARSRVGDDVLLCLSSIPRNCPPGDDRGRFYSGTNMRTGGWWSLPDSQHMCGGA